MRPLDLMLKETSPAHLTLERASQGQGQGHASSVRRRKGPQGGVQLQARRAGRRPLLLRRAGPLRRQQPARQPAHELREHPEAHRRPRLGGPGPSSAMLLQITAGIAIGLLKVAGLVAVEASGAPRCVQGEREPWRQGPCERDARGLRRLDRIREREHRHRPEGRQLIAVIRAGFAASSFRARTRRPAGGRHASPRNG